MRYFGDAWGVIVSLALAATGGPDVEQLTLRLEMSYEATDEARGLVANQKYTEASQAYADALNLGRKSALAWQEIPEDDTEHRSRALQWLVDVFCESCRLNLDHLDNVATARADAWAACMFSQYQWMEPLLCMKQVCAQDEDWIGELQMCQSLLKLPPEESPPAAEREQISNRLKELDQLLSQK